MTRLRRSRAQDGFALLEVLVATAIAAISLTVLYGMIAGSMRAARSEKAVTEAALVARSLLAEVAAGARTEPGEYWSEQAIEPRWRLRLTPAQGPERAGSPSFLAVEVAIWPLGAAAPPLEFKTEVSVHEPPRASLP